MGFLNVYNNFRNFNAHLSHAFKVTFFDDLPNTDENAASFTVKSITKPIFKLNTETYNRNFGNSRFVIPIIDFSSSRISITFYEEDNMAVQACLTSMCGNVGSVIPEIKILLEELTNDMRSIISSKVYYARLVELTLPGFNNEGEGSIQEITAEFNVMRVYNSLKEAIPPIYKYKQDYKYKFDSTTYDPVANSLKPQDIELKDLTPSQHKFMTLMDRRTRLAVQINEEQTKLENAAKLVEDAKTNEKHIEIMAGINAKVEGIKDQRKRARFTSIIGTLKVHDADATNKTIGYSFFDGISTGANTTETEIGKYETMDFLDVKNYIKDELGVELTDAELLEIITFNTAEDIVKNGNATIEKLSKEYKQVDDALNELAGDAYVQKLDQEEVKKAAGGLPIPSPVTPDNNGTGNNGSNTSSDGDKPATPAPTPKPIPTGNVAGSESAKKKGLTTGIPSGHTDKMLASKPTNKTYGAVAQNYVKLEKRFASANELYMTENSWFNMTFNKDMNYNVGKQKEILKTQYGLTDAAFENAATLARAMEELQRKLKKSKSKERMWGSSSLCGAGSAWLTMMTTMGDDFKFDLNQYDTGNMASHVKRKNVTASYQDAGASYGGTKRGKYIKFTDKAQAEAFIASLPENYNVKIEHYAEDDEGNYVYKNWGFNKKKNKNVASGNVSAGAHELHLLGNGQSSSDHFQDKGQAIPSSYMEFDKNVSREGYNEKGEKITATKKVLLIQVFQPPTGIEYYDPNSK